MCYKPWGSTVLSVVMGLWLFSSALAFGKEVNRQDHEKQHEPLEEVSEVLGGVTLGGMILLNALYYYAMGVRLWRSKTKKGVPEKFKKPIQWKTRFRNFHYIGNPIMIGMAFLHGWWAEDTNFLLWLGWGIMVFLALSGLTMKFQGADKPGAKVSRLIHYQHAFALTVIVVLVIGHTLVD